MEQCLKTIFCNCDKCSPLIKYESISDESREKWEKGLEDFKNALAERADESMRQQRKRAAEVAKLANERFLC